MKAALAALLAFLALSTISDPVLSADRTASAGDTQCETCGEDGDSESLDEDGPDQDPVYDEDDPVYDEMDDYDSYGEEEED